MSSGDEIDAVLANRRQLRTLLPNEPKWLRQVHGANVVQADTLAEVPAADASVAFQPNTVCVVLMADCLPVLLCSEDGRVIGAAHAGWRGLAAGVIENTVLAMQAPPGELLAYLGPAIGPQAFEVGNDVREAFLATDPNGARAFSPNDTAPGVNKWLADLFLLARLRLQRCGVHRIYGGNVCTHSDPVRFYSHRRDKVSGRMAALIWRSA
jgi:YfiH family protein